VALVPVSGALNGSTASGIAVPEPFLSVAIKGAAKGSLTFADWGVPAVAVSVAAVSVVRVPLTFGFVAAVLPLNVGAAPSAVAVAPVITKRAPPTPIPAVAVPPPLAPPVAVSSVNVVPIR
jgi:hypothetical protein